LRSHDLARRDGLGQAFIDVVTAMPLGQPVTVPALAQATGRHPQTVRAQLQRASRHLLLERRSRSEWVLHTEITSELFDEVAALLGEPGRPLLGRGAERARQYAEQSAEFQSACEGLPIASVVESGEPGDRRAEGVQLGDLAVLHHGDDDADDPDVGVTELMLLASGCPEPCEQDLAEAAEQEARDLRAWERDWAA
jgi:hypothetical protein